MKNQAIANDKTKHREEYLTTTELARLCGVSRFTIINWINRGKIRTVRTVGRHYRIPVPEAVSFLETLHPETLHKKKRHAASGSSVHCWECLQKTNCDKECRNCLIHGKETDYCFVAVRQFHKGAVRCKGDCLNCGYFEEFFGLDSKEMQLEESPDKRSKEAATEKRNLLYNFVYGAGRGASELKGKVAYLKKRLAGGPPQIKRQLGKYDA